MGVVVGAFPAMRLCVGRLGSRRFGLGRFGLGRFGLGRCLLPGGLGQQRGHPAEHQRDLGPPGEHVVAAVAGEHQRHLRLPGASSRQNACTLATSTGLSAPAPSQNHGMAALPGSLGSV